jgi:rod shape determining protein RodA
VTASALTRPGERDRISSKIKEIDWGLVLILCAIGAVGTMMLYSVAPLSWAPWAAKHGVRFAGCIVIMLVLTMVPLRLWSVLAYPSYAASLLLLMVVLVKGHASHGGGRWIFGVQPSEFMNVALVLTLARFYHGLSAQDARWSWKLLIPIVLIAAPMGLIAKQPDLGTALLVGFTGAAMMMMAGLDWKVIVGSLALAVAAVPVAIKFVLKGYQLDRIATFINPEADPSGHGYHILQSKIALGSGGLLGKGFGLGTQSQLNFLPEKETDFIFASFAEQFGFVGCISVLLLYGGAILIALRIASLSHSHFGRLAASGVTAAFAFYVLVNAAMVMGMLPAVGVPMPLMSYGGTEMLTVMIGFGLVEAVRVNRYAEVASGRGALL